jgi:hypothetical protein
MTTTIKTMPTDKPRFVQWWSHGECHAFIGKTDNQIKAEDEDFKKQVKNNG